MAGPFIKATNNFGQDIWISARHVVDVVDAQTHTEVHTLDGGRTHVSMPAQDLVSKIEEALADRQSSGTP